LFLLFATLVAQASDHPDAPAHVRVHLGADAVVSAPEIETAAAAHGQLIFPFVEHLGLSFSARATTHHTYGEVYVGPAIMVSHLILTPSVGVETSEFPLRGALSADWSTDRLHLLATGEYGGSGLWYQGLATYWLHPLGLGVFAQRFDGFGPRVDLEIEHFDIWSAGLYDLEDDRMGVIAGLDWHL
jgi:hypothetical protein